MLSTDLADTYITWALFLNTVYLPVLSDGPMIDYNRKSVGSDSWTDDQAQC